MFLPQKMPTIPTVMTKLTKFAGFLFHKFEYDQVDIVCTLSVHSLYTHCTLNVL